MLSTLARFSRLSRDIKFYTWMWGFLAFGYFGIWSVLFNLYLVRLGYGAETIGLLIASGQIVWAIASIPAGLVGKRIGNRNAVIWGTGLQGLMTSLILLGQFLDPTQQMTWIATCWIITWVFSALIVVNTNPYLMAVSQENERRDAFSLSQALQSLCGFVGSLAAGLLPIIVAIWSGAGKDATFNYWLPLWLTPLSYLVSCLLISRTLPQPPPAKNIVTGPNTKMPIFVLLFVGVIVFLQSAGEGTVRAFFTLYLDRALAMPIALIGIVIGLGQFLPVLSSLFAPLLLERLGTARTVMVTSFIFALFMMLLAFVSSGFAASLSYISAMLVLTVTNVGRGIFSQEAVDAEWRTHVASVFSIGLALGWATAAGIGGYLIANFGYTLLFFGGALLVATSSLLMWLYVRASKRARVSETTAVPNS